MALGLRQQLRREYFPGLFDPDGRPWLSAPESYLDAVELTLKNAFLHQQRIVVPIGYIFDNPALHAVLHRNEKDDAFLELFRECVEIGILDASTDRFDKVEIWERHLSSWLDGQDWRRVRVLPSSIPPAAADEYVKSPGYRKLFASHTQEQSGVALQHVLQLLAKAGPRRARPLGEWGFETLFHDEIMRLAPRDIAERVSHIYDKARAAGCKLSRSLLQMPDACREIGVPESSIVQSHEYHHLREIGRYCQQASFAILHGSAFSYGDGCLLVHAYRNEPRQRHILKIARELEDRVRDGRLQAFARIPIDLSAITYNDIRLLRGDVAFRDSLRNVARASATDELAAALDEHASLIRKKVVLNTLLLKDVSRTVGDGVLRARGAPDEVLARLSVALWMSLGLPFLIARAVEKYAELRVFAASLQAQLDESPD